MSSKISDFLLLILLRLKIVIKLGTERKIKDPTFRSVAHKQQETEYTEMYKAAGRLLTQDSHSVILKYNLFIFLFFLRLDSNYILFNGEEIFSVWKIKRIR